MTPLGDDGQDKAAKEKFLNRCINQEIEAALQEVIPNCWSPKPWSDNEHAVSDGEGCHENAYAEADGELGWNLAEGEPKKCKREVQDANVDEGDASHGNDAEERIRPHPFPCLSYG